MAVEAIVEIGDEGYGRWRLGGKCQSYVILLECGGKRTVLYADSELVRIYISKYLYSS